MKFTRSAISKLEIRPKAYEVFDAHLRGFGVRVTARGKKSYFVRLRKSGRDTSVNLGPVDFMELEDARKKALDILRGDYRPSRGSLLRDLSREHWAAHVERRNSARTVLDKVRYRRDFDRVLGNLEAEKLTRGQCSAAFNAYSDRHGIYQANRFLSYMHQLFEWALLEERMPMNPAHGIKKFAERQRDRVLTADEIERFMDAVGLEPEPYRQFYRLALLTGARRGELMAMKWGDLDMDERTWKIEDTKNKRPHVVSLTDGMLLELGSLERVNDYVFASRKSSKPISGFSKSFDRVRKNSGLPDIRVHDLRRTFGSILASNHMNAFAIMRAMNHKTLHAAKVYQRVADSVNREAVDMVAAAIKKRS